MRCLRIYATPDGEPHFGEIDIPVTQRSIFPGAAPFALSAHYPAQRLRFTLIPAGMREVAWHTVPERVLTVRLDGAAQYETSDGEVRHVPAGGFVLVADMHGKGHISRHSHEAQTVLWITLPNSVAAQRRSLAGGSGLSSNRASPRRAGKSSRECRCARRRLPATAADLACYNPMGYTGGRCGRSSLSRQDHSSVSRPTSGATRSGRSSSTPSLAIPMRGAVMQGTGGVRKLRWSREGIGKSGGVRVIYYFHDEEAPLFLLTLYPKRQKDDLSAAERKAIKLAVTELKQQVRQARERGQHGRKTQHRRRDR